MPTTPPDQPQTISITLSPQDYAEFLAARTDYACDTQTTIRVTVPEEADFAALLLKCAITCFYRGRTLREELGLDPIELENE